MVELYIKLLTISAIVMAAACWDDKNLPKQMKQIYKQYKRGDVQDDGVNTVRYIKAHKGSITSNSQLLFSLDALHKQDETFIRAELHFYRRSTEEMQTIQVDLSEVSPYYRSLVQRERLQPSGRGWQQMDITKTIKQCTNTINSNNQLGVSFSDVNSDMVAVAVDMPKFLRHHSLPFVLIFSNNTRSLESDQIGDVVSEIGSLIDPETGANTNQKTSKASSRTRRSVLDNRIDLQLEMDREMNKISSKTEQQEFLNVDDLYNELTNKVEVNKQGLLVDIKPALPQKVETVTEPSAIEQTTPPLVEEEIQYIPWPKVEKSKKRKNKSTGQLLPKVWKGDNSEVQQQTTKGCGRKSMRINFADIGWGDRMIEPKKFDAYYCSGECSFPNTLGKKLTNHATLQSLLTSIRTRSAVPQPCCVPQVLEPVTLMFYDEYENIVIKTYPDMSVQSCTCR